MQMIVLGGAELRVVSSRFSETRRGVVTQHGSSGVATVM